MARSLDLHAAGWQRTALEGLYWVLVMGCLGFGVLGVIMSWWILILVAAIGLAVLLYGGFIEPRLVQVTRYRLGEGEKKLRIVFLSDFHAGLKKQPSFYTRIAARTAELQPDLILLGGDFVDESAKDLNALAAILELRAPLGNWFVLGNHDFFDDPNALTANLLSYGVRNLANQALNFPLQAEASLEVIGLDDSWYGSPDLRLVEKPKKSLRIVLTHEPDLLVDLPESCADLVLLGHTHGGQIRLPGYGPITPLPQSAPQWLDQGEKFWKGMRIIISRGLAESSVRARLGSRPEIVVIDVGRADSDKI